MVEISATNELTNQLVLTFTIIILLAFFIWNKYRYDAISVAALIFLVTISSIPSLKLNIINIDQAFDGFANPAVMTVALVLIFFAEDESESPTFPKLIVPSLQKDQFVDVDWFEA